MNKVIALLPFLLAVQFGITYSQDGFATLGNGITGGSGGSRVSVSTEDELVAALADDTPRIVRITNFIELENAILVGSNKTILGASEDAGIFGHGFSLIRKSNIIIRGLHFCCAIAPDDGVTIDQSTNVWVDHNEFYSDMEYDKGYYGGLVNVIDGSDYVTISWNKFHDHYETSLVGSNDNNRRFDVDKFHITYHHNFFLNCHSRLPSVKFGTAHIYNNYYQNVEGSGINSRMGADVLVESNVFRNTKRPISTNLDSREEGYAVERNNDFGGSEIYITRSGKFINPPYPYILDRLSKVRNIVERSAGPTITF